MSVITGRDIYQDDGTLQKLRGEIKWISEEAKRIKIELGNTNTATPKGRSDVNALNNELNKLLELYKKQKITLDQLEASLQKEIQTTIQAKTAKQALAQIEREANQVTKLTVQLNSAAEGSLQKMAAQYGLNVIALRKMSEEERETTEAGKKLVKETALLNEQLKKGESSYGSHSRNVGNYENSIVKALNKQRMLVNELRAEEIAFSRLPAAIRNSVTAQERHTATTAQLRSEINQLSQVTGQNVTANEKSAGALNNLWQSAKSLLMVYISLSGLQTLGSKIFGQTKELDSLNLAYEKTIPSAEKLAETNSFLSDMAERYGIDLLSLKTAYLSYNASVQTTNLSSEQQRQIFESVSKATSILGLSTDKTKLVFKALEQMMSKGKISSEELRQQLGESLPGSLTIMAQALDVSVLELDKMLKKGEVMSEDALPKFAKQLEKAYGIENVDKIDNLASAQGRFGTAVTEVIKKLDASGVFKNFFNTLTNGMKFVGNNITAIMNLGKAILALGVAYTTWKTSMLISTSLQKIGIATTLQEITTKGLLAVTTNSLTASVKALNLAVKANPIGLIVTLITTAATAFMLFNKEVDKTSGLMGEVELATKQSLVSHKLELEKLLKVAQDETRSLNERKEAIKKINEISPEYLGNLSLETINTGEAKRATDEYIKSLENKYRVAAAEEILTKIEKERLEAIESGADKQVTTWQKVKNGVLAFGNVNAYVMKNAVTGAKNALKAEQDYAKQKEKLLGIVTTAQTPTTKTKQGSGGTDTKPKTEKLDPFGARELNAGAMEESFLKEMALLKLNFDKKKVEFEKYGVDVAILEEQLQRQKLAIQVKYYQKEIEEADKAEKERIALMPKGFEKEVAMLDSEYFIKLRTTKNKLALDKWYAAELTKLVKDENDRLYSKAVDEFQIYQDLKKSEFDLLETTEKEKTDYQIQAEIARLEKILELSLKYSQNLSDAQIAIIKNQIKRLKGELENNTGEKKDIYDILGISVNDRQKAALNDAFNTTKQMLDDYFQKQTDIANKLVELRQKETDQALEKLKIEREAQAAGYHNNVAQAEKDLKLAEKRQKDAIALQRKAQKEQILLNAALSASNMIVATAEIWKTFAKVPPVAIAMTALMWGSFFASQAKALSSAKKINKKGTYQVIGGGAHYTDNDTYIGSNNKVDNYAESGEGMAVFSRKAVSKYGDLIPKQVELFNTGKYPLINNFHKDISIKPSQTPQPQVITVKQQNGKDNLYLVPANGEKFVLIDEKGNVKKSLTVIA